MMSAFWCIFTRHAPFTLIFYYSEVEYSLCTVLLLLKLAKYPNNHFLLISVVLMMCLFSPSCSYPAPQESKWWLDPCQGRVVDHKPLHTRHGRSAEDDQLKRYIKHVNHNIKLLSSLYFNSTPESVPTIKMNNFMHLKKLEKELSGYTNELQKFYMKMQYFGECTEKLYRADVLTESNFDTSKRKRIFYNSTRQLQLVLCEYHDVLRTANVSLSEPKVHCNPKDTMLLNTAKVTDLVYFRKLKKILKKSKRTVRRYKKRQKNPRRARPHN